MQGERLKVVFFSGISKTVPDDLGSERAQEVELVRQMLKGLYLLKRNSALIFDSS